MNRLLIALIAIALVMVCSACDGADYSPPAIGQLVPRKQMRQLEAICADAQDRAATLFRVDPRSSLAGARLQKGVALLEGAVDKLGEAQVAQPGRQRYGAWIASMDFVVADLHREVQVSLVSQLRDLRLLPRRIRRGDRSQFTHARISNPRLELLERRLRKDIQDAERRARALGFRKCATMFG
jgi:hypothetical protein